MKIVLSNNSDMPIYAQIKEQIKEQIMTGIIPEDTLLPSIRQLAKDLGISVITTTRAYNELEGEGFIKTRQGKGSIVLSRDNEMMKEQYLKRIEESLECAIDNSRYASISDQELITILKTLLDGREWFWCMQ